ncbi:MAG: cupin domain-containing protein, partial [Clostridia bacterium]
MNEKDILGKHFEFVKNFFEQPIKCGYIDLYQLGDICCECGFEINNHRQLCHEISYIVSGKGDFYVNGVKTSVKEGDIFVCSHGQEHRIIASEETTLRYVYIGFLFNEYSNDDKLYKLKRFFENIENPLSIDNMDIIMPFLRVVDEFYGKSDYYNEMIESYLKQIIFLTYRSYQTEEIPIYIPQKSINAVGFTVYSV